MTKTARSTYYAWVAGREAREARQRADQALAHEITVIHLASRRNYGVPRVTAELRRQDRLVNRKRVARIMREHGIAGNSRRTGRRSLTKADTKAAPSPDLDEYDFSFQPELDPRKVKDLATLSFVEGKANAALLGPPGVGKTHIAVALAVAATRSTSPASTTWSATSSPPRRLAG